MDSYNINKSNKLKYLQDYHRITEKDFYPPEDTRLYESGIEDIDNGDNFDDYVKWFYNNYEHEIFDT